MSPNTLSLRERPAAEGGRVRVAGFAETWTLARRCRAALYQRERDLL